MVYPNERHYTATVFLFTKEKPLRVLLTHHKKLHSWLPPGGHQERMETPIDTAVRETKEETCIDIDAYIPGVTSIDTRARLIPVPDYFVEELIPEHNDQPQHYHLDTIYIIRIPYQQAVLQEKESHDIRWFTKKEALELDLFENVKKILKEQFILFENASEE